MRFHDCMHLITLCNRNARFVQTKMAKIKRRDLLRLFIVLYVDEEKPRKKRSEWVKQWLLKRRMLSHTHLMAELAMYPADWNNYMRMSEEVFLELLQMVDPFIRKKDTHLREAISPNERLCATLRFLATGANYEQLKFSTVISASSLGRIIPETCQAILTCLSKEYMKVGITYLS